VEYYFGDANLPTDQFLIEKMTEGRGKSIHIREYIDCPSARPACLVLVE
jgi:hypothetical protein